MSGGSSSTTKSQKNEQEHSVENVTRDETAKINPWGPAAQDVQALPGLARGLYDANPTGLGAMSTSAIQGLGGAADFFASRAEGMNASDVARNAVMKGMRDTELRDRSNQMWGDTSSAEQNLQGVASGQYLSGANPYMDELINRSQQDAANQVAGRFASSGRYGSGQFSRAVADTTGRIATEARMQDYEQERARQMQAAQQIDAAKMAREGLSNQTYQAFLSNRAQLSQLAPGIDQARQTLAYMPYLTKLGAGQVQDEAPWKALGLYGGITAPLAQTFGEQEAHMKGQSIKDTTRQSQEYSKTEQQQSPLQSLLGGASLLTGLFGKLSDVRAKENVEKVGEMNDGQNVYAYNYKGDHPQNRELGLLAQEVEKVRPEAVATGPDGLKRVDYAAATGKKTGNTSANLQRKPTGKKRVA
jgi:hypothetical protein